MTGSTFLFRGTKLFAESNRRVASRCSTLSNTTTSFWQGASLSLAAKRFYSAQIEEPQVQSRLALKKEELAKEIEILPEVVAQKRLGSFLAENSSQYQSLDQLLSDFHNKGFDKSLQQQEGRSNANARKTYTHNLTHGQMKTILDASLATFHLHVESRIAALCGEGYYTIGPCGEEMLSAAALAFQPCDTVALHYRHVAVAIARTLAEGAGSLEDVILDRARGYTVSRYDPVTGGVHCAIGGGSNDYVVTSTLASQCPPAVGRALGFSLAQKLLPQDREANGKSERPISYVSVGDGSVHNAHFLSALNLARHARFRRIPCPTVFAVSDNGISISYKTDGYVSALLDTLSHGGVGIPVYKVNGTNARDVYDKTMQATEYARRRSSPVILHFQDMPRRFGHAATDRQGAYRTDEEIRADHERDVIAGLMIQAVQEGVYTIQEIKQRYGEIYDMAIHSMEIASEEPKNTDRGEMINRVAAPLAQVPQQGSFCTDRDASSPEGTLATNIPNSEAPNKRRKREVVRKHTTRVIDECLANNPDVVYIGEDVEHGGYYLVTEGLAEKYPGRVIDFPPDETTLIGAGMGYSQVGLTPIVELPYAKYLDCGADMMFEAALSYWLTNGRQPNGMIVRLQGWGEGKFGGNFHTHNSLHLPPGVDVVCYSNGDDYARGFRHALLQAKAGRMVVLVDSTHLLNLRHLHDKDRGWEREYPVDKDNLLGFDNVTRYRDTVKREGKNVLVVTYGSGVIAGLQASKVLSQSNLERIGSIDVLDSPLLSEVPEGLRDALDGYSHVLFADVCKEGPNPLSAIATKLQSEGRLPQSWKLISAAKTYNPLGSTITFLSKDDIVEAIQEFETKHA
jgi:TPP-dependent pyruvate/acetoin dehydrogenase alpha subunit/pyruvate/2-oxoglutarate/acetoin dehydrogenase E1 component